MHPLIIGEHIKKRRLERGLEQEQVAIEVGVTWLNVSNWERGIYRPMKKHAHSAKQEHCEGEETDKSSSHHQGEGRWVSGPIILVRCALSKAKPRVFKS